MSFEINKFFCSILSALLVYLMASFFSELLYHKDNKKNIKLSYYVESSNKKTNVELPEGSSSLSEKITENKINDLLQSANFDKGKDFVKKNCISCHDFNLPVKNKIGPSLATVTNRKIGSVEGYKYSKTLKNIKEKWTLLNLYLFLEKPKKWAEGTKMSYRGITDTEKLLNTIKYLRNNSLSNEN